MYGVRDRLGNPMAGAEGLGTGIGVQLHAQEVQVREARRSGHMDASAQEGRLRESTPRER